MLYDNKEAYQPWINGVPPSTTYSVQVTFPPREFVQSNDNDTLIGEVPRKRIPVFERNWHSRVEFKLTNWLSRQSHIVKVRQGDLYTLLWTGDLTMLDRIRSAHTVPLLAAKLKKYLPLAASHLSSKVGDGQSLLLVPYDVTNSVLAVKNINVKTALKDIIQDAWLIKPEEVGVTVSQMIVPTSRIACFLLSETDKEAITAKLKPYLYTVKQQEGKPDNFQLKRHGYLYARSPVGVF